jgi:hypothetical protein
LIINELLKLEKKKTNIEEFFALLHGQKIHPSFLVFNNMPIDFSRISSLEAWQIENDNDFYFVLYFYSQPFIIFEVDVDALDIKNVTCINREIYRDSIIYLSNNLGLRGVPFTDRNSRIT